MNRKTTWPALILSLLLAGLGPAQADRMAERMNRAGCDGATQAIVAERSRQELENSVRIAEQAIEPPRAVGDLGCLDGLLDIDIDPFSSGGIGDLSSILDQWLDGLGRALCNFAERQWEQATSPITSVAGRIDPLQAALNPENWLPSPESVVSGATRGADVGSEVQQGADEALDPLTGGVEGDLNQRRRDAWDAILGGGG